MKEDYKKTLKEIMDEYHTSLKGLSNNDAKALLKRIGKNELKEKKKFLKLLAEKISPILEFSNYHKNMKKDAGAY